MSKEIRLNDSFDAEVEAFRRSRKGLVDNGYSSASPKGLELSTIEAYDQRWREIWKVLLKFNTLIEKDADDMDALAESVRRTDMGGR